MSYRLKSEVMSFGFFTTNALISRFENICFCNIICVAALVLVFYGGINMRSSKVPKLNASSLALESLWLGSPYGWA